MITTYILTAALVATTIYLLHTYKLNILTWIAKKNPIKEWHRPSIMLDRESIDYMERKFPQQLQHEVGEQQAIINKQTQMIQELRKKLEKPIELKTQEAAHDKHKETIKKHKENSQKMNMPNRKIWLRQTTPPFKTIGQLKNIYKKGYEVIIEYTQNGETHNTDPMPENEVFAKEFEEHISSTDTVMVNLNENGEFQPPFQIRTNAR